jgi:hypothetical protein
MEGLSDKLTDYVAFAHLWHLLEKSHSDDDINYLMLRILEIEEEALTGYGLPLTLEYSEIFQELGLKDDFVLSDIPECIEKLEQAAKVYFKRPVLSDLELLKIAQKSQIGIDLVLPELTLRLLPYTYYDFCYYFLFLKNKTTPELFLKELQIVEKYNLVKKLQELVEIPDYKGGRVYSEVKIVGLSFVDIFLENYHTFKNNRLDYLENDLPF